MIASIVRAAKHKRPTNGARVRYHRNKISTEGCLLPRLLPHARTTTSPAGIYDLIPDHLAKLATRGPPIAMFED